MSVALKKALAAIQGKTTKAGITFKNVSVVHSDETNKIIMPEGMTNNEAIKWHERAIIEEDTVVGINAPIECFPMDGAVALAKVLRELFGWTCLIPTPGFFGPSPPTMLEVEIGPGETTQVAWGRMQITGVDGYIETNYQPEGNRMIFRLTGQVRRKHEVLVKGIVEEVRRLVAEESIYRGKALKVNFRDDNNDLKAFNPGDCPKFIDVSKVVPSELIFPASTQMLVDNCLFTPIQFPERCAAENAPFKRGVLLEGPWGVGKSLTSNVVAKLATQKGITYIYVKDVRDLDKALALGATIGGKRVIFGEDVDRAVGMTRDVEVDRIFNVLDGVDTKHDEVMVILTTNDVTSINRGMIRPGRIDTIVPVRPPDLAAAVRLVRLYGRGVVEGKDEAIGGAIKVLLGSNAAMFRECVERSKLAAIRRMELAEDSGKLVIEPQDLGIAAASLEYHNELLAEKPAVDDSPVKFSHVVSEAITAGMNGSLEKVAKLAASKAVEAHEKSAH